MISEAIIVSDIDKSADEEEEELLGEGLLQRLRLSRNELLPDFPNPSDTLPTSLAQLSSLLPGLVKVL